MNYSYLESNKNLNIFIWLLILTIMSFLMILIGGLTRLTDSGLSMVDWRPISGFLPPLNYDDWIKEFNAYKKSPEFIIVNQKITLGEFQYIYLWEWFHRFFARCLGLTLIIPMVYFIIKKKLSKKLIISLLILFGFGFFQAIIGWWMVKSGLSDNPYVSQYRLAFHLTNAIIILSILFWLTMNSWFKLNVEFYPKNKIEFISSLLLFLLFFTIISGAFMAGTNAGQSFNTYPLMNGKFFPDDYLIMQTGIRNFFENVIAINFNHRWLATFTFIAIILFAFHIRNNNKIHNINLGFYLIILFAILQFLLGILTLLTNVNILFASLHQVNSILLLISLLYTYHLIKQQRGINDR